MPNEYYNLILVKGEDKTANILTWNFEKNKPIIWITYLSGKKFPYNTADVHFYKNPKAVDLTERILLKNGVPCSGVKEVKQFETHSKIFYQSGYKEVIPNNKIKTIGSALSNSKSKDVFEYYKQIANLIGMKTDDGHNILAAHYEKIKFIREDSIAATFLKGSLQNNKNSNVKSTVYPFGFNISQKQAVDNALNNKISVIEGPPGTGKTQTILNIIANAVMRGESVAVVSSNNSATLNVYEKLEKYGVEIIAAQLGNSNNKKNFIESTQNERKQFQGNQLSFEKELELKQQLETEASTLDKMLLLKNEQSKLTDERTNIQKEYEYFSENYI